MFRPSLTTFKTIKCPKLQSPSETADPCLLPHCPFLHQTNPLPPSSSTAKRPLSTTVTVLSPEPIIKRPRVSALNDSAVLIPKSFPVGSYPPSPIHQRLTYLTALGKAFKEQRIPTPNRLAIDKEYEIAQKSSKLVYGSNMKHFIRSVQKGEFNLEEEKKALFNKDKNKDIFFNLSEDQVYQKLKDLVHDEEILKKYKFITSIPTLSSDVTKEQFKPRICDRCKTSHHSESQTSANCTYHDRKRYKTSSGDLHWECCGERVGDSQGCKTTQMHVFKADIGEDLHELIPFVNVPSLKSSSRGRRVIGLDCEMGYTTKGLELIRLTVVDFINPTTTLFDEIIKPSGKILDLNTLFSGVSSIPSQVKTLNQLHRFLFEGDGSGKPPLITSETIIVGHGLENDLNALRIVHPLVVDSSILFPKGLRWKYSLKDLSMLITGVKIQQGSEGHSSEEDAIAAVNVIKGFINGIRLKE